MAKLTGIALCVIMLFVGCNETVEPGQVWRSELTGHKDLILRVDTCYEIAEYVRDSPNYGLIKGYNDSTAQCAMYSTGYDSFERVEGIKAHQLNTFFEYKTRVK